MARQFVKQLGDQDAVDEIFVASGKQLRPNRNGNLYLQVQLSDRSGAINAMLWNANEKLYRSFENGDYVRAEGTSQLYQGAIQMIVTHLTKADASEVREEDFMAINTKHIDLLSVRLGEILRGVEDVPLRSLAEAFLADDEFMRKFTRAPAGVKNHHAYVGGLLEHVVNIMEVALLIAGRYPQLDRNLLLLGIFLHDMGKIDELSYDRGFAYTDEGQLIGHLVIAVSLLEKKIAEAEQLAGEPIPEDLVLQLKHMIVSHHGSYEYGSPKLPMTLEAVALHHLDNLDAKIHSFDQLMRDDPSVDSRWTHYNVNLGRKLYKGDATVRAEGEVT